MNYPSESSSDSETFCWTCVLLVFGNTTIALLSTCYRLQRDDTAPWEQLQYECRIDWTREEKEILRQRSLEYMRSQPDDNTHYTDGSSDGTRVVATVVHKEEEIIIRLNDIRTGCCN